MGLKKTQKSTEQGIGESVRKERRTRNWSQEHLAELAGVSIDAIKFIEQGRRKNPRIETVEKIARAFGMSSIELRSNIAGDLYSKIRSAVDSAVRASSVSDEDREWLDLIHSASPEILHAVRTLLAAPSLVVQKKALK